MILFWCMGGWMCFLMPTWVLAETEPDTLGESKV